MSPMFTVCHEERSKMRFGTAAWARPSKAAEEARPRDARNFLREGGGIMLIVVAMILAFATSAVAVMIRLVGRGAVAAL